MLDSVGDVPQENDESARRAKKKIVVLGASVTVLVLALGGSFSAGYALSGVEKLVTEVAVASPDPVVVLAEVRDQPSVVAQPERIRTCSIDSLAQTPELATFSGIVIDPLSGEVLFSRNEDVSVAPASVLKLVTAAAALTTLGPEARFETKVVGSPEPTTVVLVGGGDATLSTLPEGSESVYVGAPKLSSLAQQTIASVSAALEEGERVVISEVVVDVSLWDDSDRWDASWRSDARANGFISQVTPLQVDGDRQNPAMTISRRGDNATDKAARAFVDALRDAGNTARFVRVSYGQAEPGARVLGSVQSQPVSALASYMLKESDNTLAEMLGRQVSLASGLGGSAESLNEALAGTLATRGIPAEDIVVQDSSGLSSLNRLRPSYVTTLLGEVFRSESSLAQVREGLPIAGADGSLKDRFTASTSPAAGRVFAKTGSIQGVRSLAGFISSAEGADLAFAFFSLGEVGDPTRDALDNLVTGVYSCGGNLANF